MNHYLVTYDGNYADEFDVYFHTVMNENELAQAKKKVENWEFEWEEYYFGTNESIEVSREEILECLENARELTEDEYEVLFQLDLTHISFGDGLNFDRIIGYDED